MDIPTLDGKSLALVMWGTDESGENEVIAFFGLARWDNVSLYFEHDSGQVPIDPAWYKRIQATPLSISHIVDGSEYILNLKIGPLPADYDTKDMISTGLKWPPQED